MNHYHTPIDPDFISYATILIEADLDENTLTLGEEHYTSRFKQVLRKAGLYTGDPKDLGDDTAVAIRLNVRKAVAVTGTDSLPPDEDKLRDICRRLTREADDLDDTITLAQAVAVLGYCDMTPSPLGVAFNCTVVAISLLRLGIRKLCHDRV